MYKCLCLNKDQICEDAYRAQKKLLDPLDLEL